MVSPSDYRQNLAARIVWSARSGWWQTGCLTGNTTFLQAWCLSDAKTIRMKCGVSRGLVFKGILACELHPPSHRRSITMCWSTKIPPPPPPPPLGLSYVYVIVGKGLYIQIWSGDSTPLTTRDFDAEVVYNPLHMHRPVSCSLGMTFGSKYPPPPPFPTAINLSAHG